MWKINFNFISLFLACSSVLVGADNRITTDIYWADVDGGAATLIVTPAGESILIDNGENKPLHAFRIHAVMKHAGVSRIDHLVISHWHADHYGGTHELTKLVPIRKYYANSAIPSAVPDDPAFPVLMPLYRRTNSRSTEVLRPGTRITLKRQAGTPAISLSVIASNRETIPLPTSAANNPICTQPAATAPQFDDGENAKSLVIALEFGKFRFVEVGDLTWHIEERLACPANLIGPVDLYQISHHGLDLSNNPRLVHALHPRVVVINNSPTKGAETKSMQTVLSAPGLEGVWQLYANPKTGPKLNAPANQIANPTTGPGGNFLKASILPDGSFTLQVGESGPAKTYPARR